MLLSNNRAIIQKIFNDFFYFTFFFLFIRRIIYLFNWQLKINNRDYTANAAYL